jgi:RNA polymerase sigma factor (TIGR02999 family)
VRNGVSQVEEEKLGELQRELERIAEDLIVDVALKEFVARTGGCFNSRSDGLRPRWNLTKRARRRVRKTFSTFSLRGGFDRNSSVSDVTRILEAAQQGDSKAAEELLPIVYDELRRLAAHKMAHEAPGQTLQPTALVHEAWLRLTDSTRQEWRGREHFFSAAAEAMRRILVENARRKLRLRHGGGLQRADFEGIDLRVAQDDEKCLQVGEALDRLAGVDPRKAEVVKLRMFAGLQVHEIAAVLNASEKTVQRDWTFAKAWLSRELKKGF